MTSLKIKKKRMHYLTSHQGVSRAACDVKFDIDEAAASKAQLRLDASSLACLGFAARRLLKACSVFDKDPNLEQLREDLAQGISNPLLATAVGDALKRFLQNIDTKTIDFKDSPEGSFVSAAMSLDDAADRWANGDFRESYADTVRCRSSLSSLGLED